MKKIPLPVKIVASLIGLVGSVLLFGMIWVMIIQWEQDAEKIARARQGLFIAIPAISLALWWILMGVVKGRSESRTFVFFMLPFSLAVAVYLSLFENHWVIWRTVEFWGFVLVHAGVIVLLWLPSSRTFFQET